MTKMVNPRKMRGIVQVRADGSEPATLIRQMNAAFEEFKAAQDARLDGIDKKFDDVVQAEKVERINASIAEMQQALDDTTRRIAAMQVGGAGDIADPNKRAYAQAFETWFRSGVAEADLRDLQVKAGMSTDSDPDGGYLVPEEMARGIGRVAQATSAMRGAAQVMQISSGSYSKLVTTSGAAAEWVSERADRNETDTPGLSKLTFEPAELEAMPKVTQRLLEDSQFDMAQWLAGEVAMAFGEKEGQAFIAGDGVGKPRGILSYSNVADSSYAWGKIGFIKTGNASGFVSPSASASPADCLIDLYHALKGMYRNGASWIMSDATQGEVRKFKDSNGDFIWAPPTAVGEVATVLGKPVLSDDNMPAVGSNAFPIAFGNFKRGYLIVDRTDIRVLRDPYTAKPYIAFYTTKRVGGGVQNFEAIKLLKVAA